MNRTTKLLAAAAFAMLGAGAMAQEATSDSWMTASPSLKSSAEVHAELLQARKTGLTKSWSAGYIEKLPSVKSREQVRAETLAARASGELDAIDGEAYAFAPAQDRSTRLAAR